MDRLANLLGALALAVAEGQRRAVEAELAHGGGLPAALVHLKAYPGESIEALRRVLAISQPGAVRLVDRLVGEGLAERRAGSDGRTRAVFLTSAGEEAARGLLERRAIELRALLGSLDAAERDRLEPLLERLVVGLADDRAGALRTCRLCDRGSCCAGRGCPLDHTSDPSRPPRL